MLGKGGPVNSCTTILSLRLFRYIRSHIPLDELELRARYPPVDAQGREKKRGDAGGLAGSINQ